MDSLFSELIKNISYIQTTRKELAGMSKKQMVINRMVYYIKMLDADEVDKKEYLRFVDEYVPDLIDMIVVMVRNKELIKLFKKGCGCWPPLKRCEEKEQIIDEIITKPIR